MDTKNKKADPIYDPAFVQNFDIAFHLFCMMLRTIRPSPIFYKIWPIQYVTTSITIHVAFAVYTRIVAIRPAPVLDKVWPVEDVAAAVTTKIALAHLNSSNRVPKSRFKIVV